MLRKSRVADTLKQLCADISLSSIQEGYEGVSAQQLSDFMGMDQANVSKELNQLFQENAVIKITGRPVYYFDRERMESCWRIHWNVLLFPLCRNICRNEEKCIPKMILIS